MNNTKRNLRDGTLAVMVVACMLLCAFTPAIINWNEEDASASGSSEDETFKYVSLGDSMTNAYGSIAYYYYDEELGYYQTCLGFLQDDTFSYTVQFADYLKETYGDNFEFMQMATGGFRSEELRALLYDDYVQDYLNGENDLNSRVDRVLRSPDLPDNVTNRAEFEDYLRSNLVDADLITYEYLYDIGTAISKPLLNMVEGKPAPEYDFSKYLGDEFVQIGEYVYAYVYDLILSYLGGSVAGIDPSLIDVALSIAEGAAYGVVSYCANFDANMSWLYEVGHDGKVFDGTVIVIDSYDNYGDVVFNIGGFVIPFGEILGTVFDIANVYTKYLSKWSTVTYHAAVNEDPKMMYNEFVIGETPSDDSKAVFFQSIFNLTRPDKCAETDDLVTYLSQICMVPASEIVQNNYNNNMSLFVEDFARIYTELDYDGDLTEFLSYAFGATEIDFMGVLGCVGNADKIVTKLITFLMYLRMAPANGIDVVVEVDEEDNCVVGFNVPGVMDDVVFSPTEMSFVFIAMNLMAGDNPMSHPSQDGHDYLYQCVLNASEPFDPSFILEAVKNSESIEGAKALINDFIAKYSVSPLDLTKGDVVELVNLLTDYFEPFVLDILQYDYLQGENAQIMGTKYEPLITTVSFLAAQLAEMVIDYIIFDCSIYYGDALDLRFNPLNDYDSVYFGGVFSKFDNDSKNDELEKTLMDIVSEMTADDIASLRDVDLVHIASTSGNMKFIVTELYALYTDLEDDGVLGDYEPCDYGVLSDLVGKDITDMINALRDEIAVLLSGYLSDVGDSETSKMISILVDRVAYAYVGSLLSTFGIIGMVEDVNPDASILVYSAYNELRSVDIVLDGETIPVGDYLDKVFALYNVFIYQFCEMKDNVAYVDVSTSTTALFGEEFESIMDFAVMLMIESNLVPDKQVFIDGAAEWIVTDNASYEITWVTFEGTFVDYVEHGVVPEYDGALVPENGTTYTYEFAGWNNEIVAAVGPATYVAQYNVIPNAPSDNGTVVFDVEAFDNVEIATIVTDGWSMEIPSAIFDGLEGTVEVTVDVVDVSEIPAEYRIFAGNKKVIVLDMTVGGTEVTNFGKNTVSVTFKYVPDADEKMDNISVFWIDEANGNIVEYPATYDPETGEVTFDTNHFSYWFVGERTSESDMSDVMPYIAAFLVIIAGLCVALLRMKR